MGGGDKHVGVTLGMCEACLSAVPPLWLPGKG